MNPLRLICCIALVCLFGETAYAQFYNGSQQEFGKNRVQYRDFHWIYYPGENFEVYYYQGGRDLAAYAMQVAEESHEAISQALDYPLAEKIQIVVYNKQSEWRQSNVGLASADEYNIGGSTRIIGSKMFVYYEGSHQQLAEQIKSNLTRVIFSQMMFGGDWKDVIKNSTLLSVPTWFEEGIVSYITDPWNPEVEAHVRNGILSGNYDRFNRLTDEEAQFAGHALWKYIGDTYGENVIPNILYMTRISRNIESGFLYVLGVSLDTVTAEFIEYYRARFEHLDEIKTFPETNLQGEAFSARKQERMLRKGLGDLPVRVKKHYDYSQFKVSPDGSKIAYVTNELGQYKIWLYDIETGKHRKIFKREYKLARITDKSFPILTWHPTGEMLAFTFEKKGRAYIGNYTVDTKKVQEKELFRIDKVVDFQFSDDGRRMIFSGVAEGQSDLYLYQVIGNNQQQLTNDPYDDLNPRFLEGSESVIFASNRPDDTLRTVTGSPLFNLNTDIYIMDLDDRSILERVTSTPQINESNPSSYDGKNYTYLSDETGILNRYVAYIDSTISHVDTTIHYRWFTVSNRISDLSASPVEYDFNPRNGTYSLIHLDDNRPKLSIGDIKNDLPLTSDGTAPKEAGDGDSSDSADGNFYVPEKKKKEGEVDINNYQFADDPRDYEYEKQTIHLDEFDDKGSVVQISDNDSTSTFELPKTKNYEINFATDYVLTQLDNSFANQFYQNLTGPGGSAPGLSGLIKLGVSDLFEDYKIIGGFRLSGDLENNDYALSYENLSKRLDKKVVLQRQGQRIFTGQSVVQLRTLSAEYRVSWPINELFAVKGSALYRFDKGVFLSVDAANLREPNQIANDVGLKVQLVYDNTINRGLNLYNGTRWKIWAERYQDPTDTESDLNVIGADFRHYERIHRDLILAFRLAGHTSIGDRKVATYLGGVDNWLFQRVDNSMPVSSDQGYFFQTLATPLRGFWVNSRNGNSFAVANAEIRWPIFKYLLNKPIKSDFIENFQVVGFGDVGSAWTGPHPYSPENEFNNQVTSQGPVTVTIQNNREPVIYGYGFGLRSRLLGYFVRADWAWGIDDQQILPRVFYLSLSLDF